MPIMGNKKYILTYVVYKQARDQCLQKMPTINYVS